MAKEKKRAGKEIVLYIRKDHINISIIRRIGEARELIPKHGFEFREEDITHNYGKQKELHQSPTAPNDYPHFQYYLNDQLLLHIGPLPALKSFLLSPPPSLLSLHLSASSPNDPLHHPLHKEEGEEGEEWEGEGEREEREGRGEKEEMGGKRGEEKEDEPRLGYISQGLQTFEGVFKYSTSWLSSWWSSPPPSADINNNVNNNNGGDDEGGDDEDDNDDGGDGDKKNGEEGEKKGKEGEGEGVRDFVVVQTNWYWRQQKRVLRIDEREGKIYRYHPLDFSIRAIHPLSLLRDITCYSSQSFFQLSFAKSEADPSLLYEYYSSSPSDFPLLLHLLSSLSSLSPNLLP